MRTRLWVFLVMASLAAVPVGAQETRGNINGTVQDFVGRDSWSDGHDHQR